MRTLRVVTFWWVWKAGSIGVAGRYRLVRGLVPVALARVGLGCDVRKARKIAVVLATPFCIAYLAGYLEGVNHQNKRRY